MDVGRLPQLVANFVSSRSATVYQDYGWKIPLAAPPCDFDPSNDDLMTANLKLRRALSEHWHRVPKDRRSIEQWYVSQWGGVRANSQATLDRYAASDIEEIISRGVKGIATWSKIVTLRQPERFAIYDARVAAALHALQIVNGEVIAVFPHVPSRNKVISAFQKANRTDKLLVIDASQAYRRYLDLLEAACVLRGAHSLDLCEMCLFTYAEDLIEEAASRTRRRPDR